MASNTGLTATVLCENSVSGPFGLTGEHGWSIFVETDNRKILFDTGQGQGIIANSLILGKDIMEIDAIVLSHGHYDHTGGLPQVLNLAGRRTVFCHPDVFLDRWWIKDDTQREIGLRYKRSWLESIGADFQFHRDFREIYPGIYITGEVPRITSFEPVDPHMKLRTSDRGWTQDPLFDDLSMVIETEKGLVVVLGCAHAGLINILEHVRKMLPKRPIHTVVGGTHLGFADITQFEKTVEALDRFDIKRLGASHCTGLENGARLYNRLGDRFFFASAGTTIQI